MKTRIIIAITIIILMGGLSYINYLSKNDKKEIKINETNKQDITNKTTKMISSTTKAKTTVKSSKKAITTSNKVGTYKLTHYGWDCKGCSGNTASGYNVRNTIYYNDATYAKLRIVAMKDLPLYSVIKIKNYKLGGDIYAIVLDRGVGSGVIDLAVENEKVASKYGIQNNVEIEIIRSGK